MFKVTSFKYYKVCVLIDCNFDNPKSGLRLSILFGFRNSELKKIMTISLYD